jgi:hypothetical protein
MRKLGLSLFLLIPAGAAFASDCSYQLDAEPNPDYFTRLEARFDRGTPACKRPADGWLTLRCFDHWNKNIAHGGLLAFKFDGNVSTDLCADQTGFQFQEVRGISSDYGDSTTYFDYIDSPLRTWIEDYLFERWFRYSAVYFDGQGMVTYPNWVDVSYHLRQDGDTLILKTVDEGSYGTPGETLDLCYAVGPVQQNADQGQPHTGTADAAMDWGRIEALYAKGTLPTREAIEGWWSGRCFLADEPTRAVATLLGAEDTGVHGDHGPIGEYAFKLNHIVREGLAPGFFDDLANFRLEVARRALSGHADVAGVAFARDGSLVSREIGLSCVDYELRARMAGQYVVAEMVSEDKVVGECYFFARTPTQTGSK